MGGRTAQAGPLNPPPGPITGTGKTLTEVDPRIVINEINTPGDANSVFRITRPGCDDLTVNAYGEIGMCGVAIRSGSVVSRCPSVRKSFLRIAADRGNVVGTLSTTEPQPISRSGSRVRDQSARSIPWNAP
jgi:hypothetical protein